MQILLLLIAVALIVFLIVNRKRGSRRAAAPPAPAAAMEAAGSSEQYGPSIDEVEREEPPVEIAPEPIVEVEAEPVVEVPPEPVLEPEPVAVEPTPEPVSPEPETGPVIEIGAEPQPVLEISYPLPTDEAPPGLAVDAFKDIKPVAFGGIAVEATEPAPEPEVEAQPEPAIEVHPEPIVEAPPVRDFEPLSHPGVADVPTVEPDFAPEPAPVVEEALVEEPLVEEPLVEEPLVEEPVVEEPKPKKRGFRIPNPELKLPGFGTKSARPKSGLKLPQITLPTNLQGPLSDLERKIALGSILAIVAAGAFGYATAPSDDATAPPPTPAPAAASR